MSHTGQNKQLRVLDFFQLWVGYTEPGGGGGGGPGVASRAFVKIYVPKLKTLKFVGYCLNF